MVTGRLGVVFRSLQLELDTEMWNGYDGPGLLSHRVEKGSLGVNATTCLLIKLLFFTLLHAARCVELLEDASLR